VLIPCCFRVDSVWISCGFRVDSVWIPCGFRVDSVWIPCGFRVDSVWIRLRSVFETANRIVQVRRVGPLQKLMNHALDKLLDYHHFLASTGGNSSNRW